jgi:5-methylcytosine-specific restriction endonuclease McrA
VSPQTPEQRAAYGDDWPAVRVAVKERANNRCECVGECGWLKHVDSVGHTAEGGRCEALNGDPSPYTGSRVVLTVAHLDRDGHTGTNTPDRLKAMCQGCHLAYDRQERTR